MTGNKPATVVISKTAPMPAAMPKIPPANARITDSARNCMGDPSSLVGYASAGWGGSADADREPKRKK